MLADPGVAVDPVFAMSLPSPNSKVRLNRNLKRPMRQQFHRIARPSQSSGTPEKIPTRMRWLWRQCVSRYLETSRALGRREKGGRGGSRQLVDEIRTHIWKFGYDYSQYGKEVDDKVSEVVVGVVCAEQEEYDRHTEQEFLGGCILSSIINLLTHVQVVIGASVELKGHASDVMEHDVRAEHVRDVG